MQASRLCCLASQAMSPSFTGCMHQEPMRLTLSDPSHPWAPTAACRSHLQAPTRVALVVPAPLTLQLPVKSCS